MALASAALRSLVRAEAQDVELMPFFQAVERDINARLPPATAAREDEAWRSGALSEHAAIGSTAAVACSHGLKSGDLSEVSQGHHST